jgi:DNA polymerase-1
VPQPRPEYVFSLDSETFLLRPGVQAPPIVCLAHKVSVPKTGAAADRTLLHARDPRALEILTWALTHAIVTGHRVAYDLCCAATSWPHLLPLIFRAYEEDRVTCTLLREVLSDIARGVSLESQAYGLDSVLEKHTGRTVNKLDPWRAKYGTLWVLDIEDWPGDARSYALGDVDAAHDIYYAQEAAYRSQGWLEDEYAQARADFWLNLTSAHGIRTDAQRVPEYYAETLAASEKDRAIAAQAGLVRGDGTRDTKLAMARMVAVMESLGEDPPLTDTGEKKLKELRKSNPSATWRDIWTSEGKCISTDEDSCLASGDFILEAYQRFGSLKTRLSRAARLYKGFDLPLQASFRALVETGRTSCTQGEVEEGVSPPAWGTQLQNMNTGMVYNPETKQMVYKPGMRECFVPRQGDYTPQAKALAAGQPIQFSWTQPARQLA